MVPVTNVVRGIFLSSVDSQEISAEHTESSVAAGNALVRTGPIRGVRSSVEIAVIRAVVGRLHALDRDAMNFAGPLLGDSHRHHDWCLSEIEKAP